MNYFSRPSSSPYGCPPHGLLKFQVPKLSTLFFSLFTSLALLSSICLNTPAALSAPALSTNFTTSTSSNRPDNSVSLDQNRSVIIYLSDALTWKDISSAQNSQPQIWAQARLANQVSRTVDLHTCPFDALLSISAAKPVSSQTGSWAEELNGRSCRPVVDELNELIAGEKSSSGQTWERLRRYLSTTTSPGQIGALGEYLKNKQVKTFAFGPAAQILLATNDGPAPLATVHSSSTGKNAPFVAVHDLLGQSAAEVLKQVENEVSKTASAPTTSLNSYANKTPLVLVISLPAEQEGKEIPKLRPVVIFGTGSGSLNSNETRTNGLVRLTALAPTIVKFTVPSSSDFPGINQSWQFSTKSFSPLDGLKSQQKSHTTLQLGISATISYFGFFILFGLIIWLVFDSRLRSAHSRFAIKLRAKPHMWLFFSASLAWVPVFSLFTVWIPGLEKNYFLNLGILWGASFLAAIFSELSSRKFYSYTQKNSLVSTDLSLLASSLALAIAVPLFLIFAPTYLMQSAWGTSPAGAGRFFGLTNHLYSLWASALLVLNGLGWKYLHPSKKSAFSKGSNSYSPIILGFLALMLVSSAIFDLHPSFGADFGGFLPLCLTAIWLIAALFLNKFRWKTLFNTCAFLLLLTFLGAFLDYLRPANKRTHLGLFLGYFLDGNANQAIATLARKFDSLARTTLIFLICAILAASLIILIYRLLRVPSASVYIFDAPIRKFLGKSVNKPILELRHPRQVLVIASFCLAISASLLNDSGFLMAGLMLVTLGNAGIYQFINNFLGNKSKI